MEHAPPLSLGRSDAHKHVEVFLNTACPYCVNFFLAAHEALMPRVEAGDVRYTIKHYDKPKVRLLHGTIANLFIDYNQPGRAYDLLHSLFRTQQEWRLLDSSEIEKMMQQEYGCEEQRSTMNLSLDITKEALERSITAVPTVFINDEVFKFESRGPIGEVAERLVKAIDSI
ncbi:thioredoxin domain-containing protein [Salinicoccus hispanicus]|uniref:Thioredoxin domain-containing protein n=1 Tax=Salinicoccus hispanicus TaxID=157225 RepID=A0A6N8U0H7_9STAP|nr:thioredoxin domain-containing protein [Salinicoccus hispanicus]MXQ51263.1 thioredoxin domain-containing protein [Salinicoccus hispanicus]